MYRNMIQKWMRYVQKWHDKSYRPNWSCSCIRWCTVKRSDAICNMAEVKLGRLIYTHLLLKQVFSAVDISFIFVFEDLNTSVSPCTQWPRLGKGGLGSTLAFFAWMKSPSESLSDRVRSIISHLVILQRSKLIDWRTDLDVAPEPAN